MRAIAGGRDLVVWRSASGRLSAWDNRCPHRGMRLSFGFVRGETLACLYHGWQYAAESGRCRLIPAHPDLDPPETIHARAYPVGEAHGLIWVAPDDGPLDMPAPGVATAPLRSLVIAAGATDVRAAFCATPFGGEPVQVRADGPLLCLSAGGIAVALVLQDIAPGETATHVLTEPSAGRTALTRLSRWCESVRRAAEAPPPRMPTATAQRRKEEPA